MKAITNLYRENCNENGSSYKMARCRDCAFAVIKDDFYVSHCTCMPNAASDRFPLSPNFFCAYGEAKDPHFDENRDMSKDEYIASLEETIERDTKAEREEYCLNADKVSENTVEEILELVSDFDLCDPDELRELISKRRAGKI